MAIRGTVTRVNGSKLPWKSCYANGEFAGIFASLRDAQLPIEQAANARLRWVEETAASFTGLESYRGEDV